MIPCIEVEHKLPYSLHSYASLLLDKFLVDIRIVSLRIAIAILGQVLKDGWLNGAAVLGVPAKATIKEVIVLLSCVI